MTNDHRYISLLLPNIMEGQYISSNKIRWKRSSSNGNEIKEFWSLTLLLLVDDVG